MLQESSLRPATVADGCLHRHAESNFRFVPVAQTQYPSTSRKPSLKKSLSSPINQAMFNSFVRRKKQSLPDVRLHVGSSIDRYASGSANRQGPATTRRSLQNARYARRLFSVDSQLQSQAARETHVVLFLPSWKRKPLLIFVFGIWSQRMFIWSQ